ncbi:MAG: hypothetical protein JWO38_2284 [Gemmataceae bacterium]|nr:hypothetical protein [Gemmataceae bacterium]
MSWTTGLSFAALTLGIAFGPTSVSAADSELRTFGVTVDGKPAGTFKMAVRVEDDGTETIAAVADVKVKVTAGLLTYTYALQSLEVWRGGRLVSVEANANNDGKKTAVKAAAGADGLAVTVSGKAHKASADAITSTGWRHPGVTDKARDLMMFDTEDGSETAVRVEPLGAARVTLGGRTIEGRRVRLTGKDVDSVWWFDAAGRPIRQEMNWDGHKVVLELSGITR